MHVNNKVNNLKEHWYDIIARDCTWSWNNANVWKKEKKYLTRTNCWGAMISEDHSESPRDIVRARAKIWNGPKQWGCARERGSRRWEYRRVQLLAHRREEERLRERQPRTSIFEVREGVGLAVTVISEGFTCLLRISGFRF